jgi:hypothetical protein
MCRQIAALAEHGTRPGPKSQNRPRNDEKTCFGLEKSQQALGCWRLVGRRHVNRDGWPNWRVRKGMNCPLLGVHNIHAHDGLSCQMKVVLSRTIDHRFLPLIPMYFSYSSKNSNSLHLKLYGTNHMNEGMMKHSTARQIAVVQKIDAPTNEYPPMNTQFKALRELVELDYDWYVRCDPDTVVNENMLMYELREMSNVTYPVAYGKYGYGRKNEQPFLEISYYLQGGFCDTFNRATALVLRTRLEACRKWSWQHIPRKYLHSDVEISRCMLRNNVSLRNWPAKLTHPTYKISRARKKVLIDPTLDQI